MSAVGVAGQRGAMAGHVDGRVAGHRGHERRLRAAVGVEPVGRPPQPQHRLLHEVVPRPGAVVATAGDGPHEGLEAADELAHRVLVARGDEGEERGGWGEDGGGGGHAGTPGRVGAASSLWA